MGVIAGQGNNSVSSKIHDVQAQLRDAIGNLRDVAHSLSPAELRQFGLSPAIRELVEKHDLHTELNLSTERFSAVTESTAFFFVSEALSNCVKHSRASEVSIDLHSVDRMLLIRFADNGTVSAHALARSGLLGLEDRVTGIGGTCHFELTPGQPAVLTAWLPLISNGWTKPHQQH